MCTQHVYSICLMIIVFKIILYFQLFKSLNSIKYLGFSIYILCLYSLFFALLEFVWATLELSLLSGSSFISFILCSVITSLLLSAFSFLVFLDRKGLFSNRLRKIVTETRPDNGLPCQKNC